jgi:cellulose synthase/poly-beta-1,6-N-acetylglucosamine synthase-like glycosyltransferase
MLISVIVPAYQAAVVLPQCLAALQQQTIDRAQYEIIVVDDGSTDDTANVAHQALRNFSEAQVIRAAHGGPAHARNLGAQMAHGDLLLFTDTDCEPRPDWLEQCARVCGDPSISGAAGAYATRQRSLIARFVQQEYEERYDYARRQATIDFIDTYSAAYRREVFLDSGGFAAELFPTASVEDQEFSFRLAERGYRLVFVPEAKVYHQHNTTLARYFRRKYYIGYWKMRVLKQHPGKAVRDSHTPQIVKAQIVLLAAALISLPGLFGWPLTIGLWITFGLSLLPLSIRIARRDPPVLLIAPIMIFIRALALGLGLFVGLLRFYIFRRTAT